MTDQESPTLVFYRFLAWLEANKTSLIIAFVAVVVIGFSIAAYFWRIDQNQRAANDALLRLKTSARATPNATTPEAADYLRIVEQYSGTGAADRALLLAASSLFAENKYTEAHAQFDRFLRQNPQNPLAPTAAFGVAASLEAQTKTDEALASFQNLSVRYPNSPMAEDAKLAMARIYETKGQPELALRIYDELIRPTDLRGSANEAVARREYLLARFPALGQTTNAPASGQTIPLAPPAADDANLSSLSATNSSVAQP
jgi:tetratricopeptide (TPR) repeat protein